MCRSDTHTHTYIQTARNQTSPVIDSNQHRHTLADPKHCCETITRTWIHFQPQQHTLFTGAYATRKQCVGYTTTLTRKNTITLAFR